MKKKPQQTPLLSGDHYLYMRNKASGLPQIEVVYSDFITMMMASGKTYAESRGQAEIAKALGSAVMIGDKMVKIAK